MRTDLEYRECKNDYLKYWRVVRHWALVQYELYPADLDMILYLYSEKYFKTADFRGYANIMSWDKKRWRRLLNNGWVQEFRPRSGNKGAIYQLSPKAKTCVATIYRKLNGEEFAETRKRNKFMNSRKKLRFTDKMYRDYMLKINEEIRALQQRRAQESQND